MTDPRKMLTEETPESRQDFQKRQLTEVGGTIQHDPQPKILTEDLPEDEETSGPQDLMG